MDVATLKLKLSAKPHIGRVNVSSANSRISSDIPRSSLPMTMQIGPSSQSISLTSFELGFKSLAYTLYPCTSRISRIASAVEPWFLRLSHCALPIAVLIPRFWLRACFLEYIPDSMTTSTFWMPNESMVRRQAQTLLGFDGFSNRNLLRLVRCFSTVLTLCKRSSLIKGSKISFAAFIICGSRFLNALFSSSIFLAANLSSLASSASSRFSPAASAALLPNLLSCLGLRENS
mmetsp:Transcript_19150/g.27943  ORF Transcript_19150/g.27943 Transcript_19150/m.27943 type:complete len:232 (+) Transcript_19150:356-1051(+)